MSYFLSTADTPPLEGSGVGSGGVGSGGVGSGGVQVCGGRCGDHSCMLSFSSAHTLSQHIQLGQLQCTSVSLTHSHSCVCECAVIVEHNKQCVCIHVHICMCIIM